MKQIKLFPGFHTYVLGMTEYEEKHSHIPLDHFDTRFPPFILSRQLTKENLAKTAGIDYSFDYALPQDWFNRELKMGTDLTYFVWGYPPTNRIFGTPVNLMDLAKPIIIQRIVDELTKGDYGETRTS